MKQFYYHAFFALLLSFQAFLPNKAFAQPCSSLQATLTVSESRCASTGSIAINVTGGSGTYLYKCTGPVNINYTSSNTLTGLSAGLYLVKVQDAVTNCIFSQDSVLVSGNYITPNFQMTPTGVTCANGSDGTITVTSQTNGRGPFIYKIIAPSPSNVGVTSATGLFTGLSSGNYLVQLGDSCGGIQTRGITVLNYDWNINSAAVTRLDCDNISVVLSLLDSKGNTSPNAIFNGYTYGATGSAGDTTWFGSRNFTYHIGNHRFITLIAKDRCGLMRFTTWQRPEVYMDNVIQVNYTSCSTISLNIGSTFSVNLTNPQYCLFDHNNVQLACNASGLFTGLPFGAYCIKVSDTCYDTSFYRCIEVVKPVPSVSETVSLSSSCNSMSGSITGQTNLSNPTYCLFDNNNAQVMCNSTGTFNGIPYGSYCIKITNDPGCYDTVITRCFYLDRPIPTANIATGNLSCSTFTANVVDTSNWVNPQFCLYTDTHVLIMCNSTGVFNNIPYGSYCIDVTNGPGCLDTTIQRCFTVTRPLPVVSASVVISGQTCTAFNAVIKTEAYVTNPLFTLYDSLGNQLMQNSFGLFLNLPYGSYCISIKNDANCYDTTIQRCFSVAPSEVNFDLSAAQSCARIGASDISANIVTGMAPYNIKLYSGNVLLRSATNVNSGIYTFFGVVAPSLTSTFKIIVTDQCGRQDTDSLLPNPSLLAKTINFTSRCPSSSSPQGSKDVTIDMDNTNITGSITCRIFKRNNVFAGTWAGYVTGNKFTFYELSPATYIFDSYLVDCHKHIYDTVVVQQYVFPSLSGSRAFQCDNAGFSVNANAVNGLAPYAYEIFGSLPASPSIITSPQANASFNINNGSTYSLIRLRVIDACGNASLYDASVLPMAQFIAFPNKRECFNEALNLLVDSVPQADYQWFKRTLTNDSILVGTNPTYHIDNLTLADTGRYVCKIVMNNGCLVKYANYVLTGFCQGVLPVATSLAGKKQADGNKLMWPAPATTVKEFALERKTDNGNFELLTVVKASEVKSYSYMDYTPKQGNNYYRLVIKDLDGKATYTNEVLIKNSSFGISFYPNPVTTELNITVANAANGYYAIQLVNIAGKQIMMQKLNGSQNKSMTIRKPAGLTAGLYLLKITETGTSNQETFKVIFE